MVIVLYDFSNHLKSNTTWTSSTWRARYLLNYKGIPYRTEWVEYCDIETYAIENGLPPSGTKDDGTPKYTFPSIYDPSTGAKVTDSLAIADYLEKTYPDAPTIFPNGTRAEHGELKAYSSATTQAFNIEYFFGGILSPRSEKHLRAVWEPVFGKRLEDLRPVGEERIKHWAVIKEDVGRMNAWFEKNEGKGPFVLGDVVSWADLLAGSQLRSFKTIWGEGSKEWADVETWHEGRWKNLIDALEKYEAMA